MTRAFPFVLACLALAASLLLLAAVWGRILYTGPGPLPVAQLVVIPRGDGVSMIATRLHRAGVIPHPLLFQALAVALPAPLHAGEYEFPVRVSLLDAYRRMVTGDVYVRLLTIPEGLTTHQVLQKLNEIDVLVGPVPDNVPEGALLPDTYRYSSGDTRQALVDRMRTAMDKVIADAWSQRPDGTPLTTQAEMVALAAIVEKETGIAAERPRIAGVFLNRLRLGMKLQSDPTVIYGLTEGKPEQDGQGPLGRRLLRKDMRQDSLYNTYKYAGLPPGPIANPGRDAIMATVKPEAHQYLYFVADGTGGHVFAKTFKEHDRNVSKWRKIRSKD
ncbi:MAG: endolytic transglycosylase MltG [Pseudomonadota bacterium]